LLFSRTAGAQIADALALARLAILETRPTQQLHPGPCNFPGSCNAQAELHIIRARLHGGKLNKASRGELRFPLPVGFVFEGDKIVLDPDREVQGAVRMIFDLFECQGTAYGAVRRFQELGLRFPRRAYGGAWDGNSHVLCSPAPELPMPNGGGVIVTRRGTRMSTCSPKGNPAGDEPAGRDRAARPAGCRRPRFADTSIAPAGDRHANDSIVLTLHHEHWQPDIQ
jgi:hypothetical protein